jgi:3-hydroxyacyl-[acyl-carrier protein] dehydratase/trans-2-decenoyl-[acyl-carrier protein] isomerase
MLKEQQNSYSRDELLACGHGQIFGPGNARLPLPPMLMFDRITTINEDGGSKGKGQIVAELDVKPDLWFFDCHFETDPVMPGCLGLLSWLAWWRRSGSGAGCGRGKIFRPGNTEKQAGDLSH